MTMHTKVMTDLSILLMSAVAFTLIIQGFALDNYSWVVNAELSGQPAIDFLLFAWKKASLISLVVFGIFVSIYFLLGFKGRQSRGG